MKQTVIIILVLALLFTATSCTAFNQMLPVTDEPGKYYLAETTSILFFFHVYSIYVVESGNKKPWKFKTIFKAK